MNDYRPRVVGKLLFKKYIKFAIVLAVITLSCGRSQYVLSTADDLAKHIDQNVVVKGTVVHVCPVSNKLMKMRLEDGTMIQVLPSASDAQFELSENENDSTITLLAPNSEAIKYMDAEWGEKEILACGSLTAKHISRQYIDSLYDAKILTCHVNRGPCIDSVYVSNMWKKGKAQASLAGSREELYKQMEATGQDYIVIYSLTAEKIEEIK